MKTQMTLSRTKRTQWSNYRRYSL